MTISSTTRKVGPLIGNGVATSFAFPFKIFEEEDLLAVQFNVATGVETDLVLNKDYTVSLNADQDANPGGSITLTVALATGFNLTLTSDQPDLQEVDITNQGAFYPEVITGGLDGLCIEIQQLREQANRSLRFPISDPPLDAVLPAAAERAGHNLSFDENGNLQSGDQWELEAFAGALLGAQDGNNKIFTLTNNGTPLGQTPQEPIVWNNYPLVPGSGYTLGPGVDQVTFAVAPDPLDTLYGQGFIYLVAPVAPALTGSAFFAGPLSGAQNLTNTVFTLTNNGSPLIGAPDQVFVWQNFPLAPGVGYTLGPNPNQVTLTTPPKATDTLYAQGILPGGLTGFPSTVLSGAQDPNTLTAQGIYYLPDGMVGPTIPQPPHEWNSTGGVLEVFNYPGDPTHTQYVMQRYQTAYDFQFAPGEIFVRWYTDYTGTLGWTPWIDVGNIGTCINTAATADLNTFTEAGVYYFPFGTGPNTPNPPTGAINSDGSILEVLSYSNAAYNPYILQRFTLSQDCWSGAAPGRFFERWNWNNAGTQTWSPWFYYLPAGTA